MWLLIMIFNLFNVSIKSIIQLVNLVCDLLIQGIPAFCDFTIRDPRYFVIYMIYRSLVEAVQGIALSSVGTFHVPFAQF